MSNFPVLFLGEWQRLRRYHILTASLIVALLWIGVLYFSDIQDLSTIFPLLVFIDATSMAIILIGATMFFEREEGALKTLFISPINRSEYVLAKTTAGLSSNLLTLYLLFAYATIFRELDLNFPGLVLAVILISGFHSLVGFLLTYRSRTFTDLLMGMFVYFLGLALPVVLDMIGLIDSQIISNLLYLLPTKAAYLLLVGTAGLAETWEIVFSALYLIILGGLLYGQVIRKFYDFAARESGVG